MITKKARKVNRLAKISVYAGPVSNITRKKDVTWPELAALLISDPMKLPDNSSTEKAKGSYFVRGLTNGKRADEHLVECSLVILDIDKQDGNTPLPQPTEIHEALSDVAHATYNTATAGRSRIVLPVEPYPKEKTGEVTKAAYEFCRERGLNFVLSTESSTKSQPFFLPQTTVFCDHQAYAKIKGKFFDYSVTETLPEQEPASTTTTTITNHLQTVIDELKSGTIHRAVLSYAGWQCKTTNLTIKQIFNDITVLVDEHCSDPEKVARWHKDELAGFKKWFSTNVPKDEPKFTDLLSFEVSMEYVSKLEDEKPLYPNLILSNHVATYIAMSGGGKTTIMYFHVAPRLAADGLIVYYVDADSPPSDHKKMKDFADRHGFKFLNPDANIGTNAEQLIEVLKGYATEQKDLTGNVFFFDTLKKFANLMSKDSVKDFYVLTRKLTALGATIVLLGHANKFKDKEGNLIFEGVNDVRSDSDELIFLEATPDMFGGLTVTTIVDPLKGAKVRGLFEPISFRITEDREVTMLDKAISFNDGKTQTVPDLDLIIEAEAYLKSVTEPVLQKELIKSVAAAIGVGRERVTRVIKRNSALEGTDTTGTKRFIYRRGDKLSYLYLPILKN